MKPTNKKTNMKPINPRSTLTVGQLIEELSQHDKSMPVYINHSNNVFSFGISYVHVIEAGSEDGRWNIVWEYNPTQPVVEIHSSIIEPGQGNKTRAKKWKGQK